jgi:hypothetical protein
LIGKTLNLRWYIKRFPFCQGWVFLSACFILCLVATAKEPVGAEAVARAAVAPLEKMGYVFRADPWIKEVSPELGKAVRLQLFKGHDYRFAVTRESDLPAFISAAVLDFEGRIISQELPATEAGKCVLLSVKPKQTGVYVVTVRQLEVTDKSKPVTCCILTGYK